MCVRSKYPGVSPSASIARRINSFLFVCPERRKAEQKHEIIWNYEWISSNKQQFECTDNKHRICFILLWSLPCSQNDHASRVRFQVHVSLSINWRKIWLLSTVDNNVIPHQFLKPHLVDSYLGKFAGTWQYKYSKQLNVHLNIDPFSARLTSYGASLWCSTSCGRWSCWSPPSSSSRASRGRPRSSTSACPRLTPGATWSPTSGSWRWWWRAMCSSSWARASWTNSQCQGRRAQSPRKWTKSGKNWTWFRYFVCQIYVNWCDVCQVWN